MEPMPKGSTTVDQSQLREALKMTLDIWRSQIDSYWTRNSYFVTFHTAIMAAVWEIRRIQICPHREDWQPRAFVMQACFWRLSGL